MGQLFTSHGHGKTLYYYLSGVVRGCAGPGVKMSLWLNILTAGHCRNGVEVVRVGEWEVVDTSKVKEMEYTYACTAYSEEQCRRNRGNIRWTDSMGRWTAWWRDQVPQCVQKGIRI